MKLKTQNSHPRRLLVIDDNPAIHQDFRKILGSDTEAQNALNAAEAALFGDNNGTGAESSGYEIDGASQGQEGLQLVQRALEAGRPYAMAFVDVRMPPGWDGIETIQHLWQACPELQIVICTAYSDYTWADITRTLGKSDSLLILKKPFDNAEVLQLAEALTKKWALTQQAKSERARLDELVASSVRELQTTNERLQAEVRERTRAEERFATAFNSSPIAMALQTVAEGRFVDFNASFLTLLGMAREEVVGRRTEDLQLWPEDGGWAAVDAHLRASQPVREMNCKLRIAADTVRDTIVSAERLDIGGEAHILLIVQDISGRLLLESQLRQAQKMEAVGQLAAGVAHDFNNLLTIIQGHALLRLSAAQLPDEFRDSLEQVVHASERAARLTRQLLTFSRKQFVQLKPLRLHEVLTHLGDWLRRLIGENIRLQFESPEQLPPISADEGAIEQLVMNLAVNARDAMPNGGQLSLRMAVVEVSSETAQRNPEARAGCSVRLTVADTGCGMDRATLDRIFEPFFTTKPVGQGTGLGLSTVYGIVKQHHGWIEVASQVGQGTTFTVYFPVCAESATPAPRTPLTDTEILRRSLGRETILVVEDEPLLRELTSTVLKGCGFQVLEAGHGPEALEVWERANGRVDLLLTDMVMPEGLTGRQLAEKLRDKKPALKVIFTSGYSVELSGIDLTAQGRQRFLAKPFAPPSLVQTVRECLDLGV